MRNLIDLVTLNEWNPFSKKEEPYTPERAPGTLSAADQNQMKREFALLIQRYGVQPEEFIRKVNHWTHQDVRYYASQGAPAKKK
jgi:hypothetical protein